MKSTFALLALLFLFHPASAQMDSTLVEQYCELVANKRMFSNKVTIDVNFGEERKFFSFDDTRVKDDIGNIKKFNSVTDALNYLGKQGWKLVNAFPVTESDNIAVYHFFFKKSFYKFELENNEKK